MKLDFDSRGNLSPHEKVEISLDEFKKFFVGDFTNGNQRRLKIFEDYLNFVDEFKKEVTDEFVHWIDGSFVTRKVNPRDIDFVTLVDYKTYEQYEILIENKFRRHQAKNIFGLVDAYVVKMYPLGHPRRWVCDFDLVYWRRWFGETKKNRAKKKFSKGFVEIRFSDF